MSSGKVLAVLALLAAAGGGGWAWWHGRGAAAPSGGPEARYVPVRKDAVRQVVREIGHLQPYVLIDVKPEISGRVAEVLTDLGKEVKAGDLLLRLDDRILLKQLEQVRIQVEQARLTEGKMQRNLDRRLQLDRESKGLISPEELEQARTDHDLSVVARRESELKVQEVEEQLQHTTIKAPIDGTVIGLAVKPGDVVIGTTTSGNPTSLFLVADTRQMVVDVMVNEMDYPKVQIGQPVEARAMALGTDTFPGKVVKLGLAGVADAKNKNLITYPVEAVVKDRSGRLRAGMTATVDIVTASKADAILVPREAVLLREGRCRLVRLRNGTEETLDLDAGLETETEVEIPSGLEPGDQVKLGAWKDGDLDAFLKDVTDRRKKRAGHSRF